MSAFLCDSYDVIDSSMFDIRLLLHVLYMISVRLNLDSKAAAAYHTSYEVFLSCKRTSEFLFQFLCDI